MRKALLTGTAAIAIGMFGFGINAAHAISTINVTAGCNLLACLQHNHGGANAQGASNTAVNANGNLSHDLNGNKVLGNGNSGRSATAIGGNASSNTQENSGRSATVNGTGNASSISNADSGRSATVNGNGTANSMNNSGRSATVGGSGLANSNSGNENFGAQGLLFGSAQVGNGFLAEINSNNHVHVDVTLAHASAGGDVSGDVSNNNQNGGGSHYVRATFDNGSDVTNVAKGSVGVFTMNANGNGIQQANTSVAIGAVNSGATLISK